LCSAIQPHRPIAKGQRYDPVRIMTMVNESFSNRVGSLTPLFFASEATQFSGRRNIGTASSRHSSPCRRLPGSTCPVQPDRKTL
jgi:hypothetical protein